jgi:hypothetical protein
MSGKKRSSRVNALLEGVARPFKVLRALWRTMTSRDTRKVTDDPNW